MARISAELKREAENAFARYARVFEERVVRREGWTLYPQPLFDVLESGDEIRVQRFITNLNCGHRDMLNAVIV
jgi:hypothetical protein